MKRPAFILPLALLALLARILGGGAALAASPTAPIKLAYVEGDVAGTTMIWSEDGKRVLGIIEYRQHLEKDRLRITRVARFRDGSRDEDEADVRVGARMEAIAGRSVIRDKRGTPIVDVKIDVAGKRLTGFYVDDGKRTAVDEEVDIGPGTCWGPLFNLVAKNFEANADADAVVFQTVAVTPKPRVIDMELKRIGPATATRIAGGTVKTTRFTLLPTVNFLIDPILRRFVPMTEFFLDAGKPPTVIRYAGPRNYAGQRMRLE
jgi:hypothetical protein